MSKDFSAACAKIQAQLLSIDKRALKLAKKHGFDGCADLLIGHLRAAIALMDPTYRKMRANKAANPFVRQAYLESLLGRLGCRGMKPKKATPPRVFPTKPPDASVN